MCDVDMYVKESLNFELASAKWLCRSSFEGIGRSSDIGADDVFVWLIAA